MTVREPPPIRRIDGPARDVLDDGTDVTRVSDRDLLLRVANGQLEAQFAIGQLAGEVSRNTKELAQVRAWMSDFRGKLESVPDIVDDRVEQTSPVAVQHALDLRELDASRKRRELVAKITVGCLSMAGGGILIALLERIFHVPIPH
jgi:hypothetical protein